ncbi:MAG: zinc-ribbon domain-containing protein [Deltaproteobacteria bacterium]|nr:zinc-ribbon domain-containing protein [Deltaproteobacteria bacterium]
MIIQCEKCRTKFNLDESLIKKEGSKVRCSRCGDVFMAYPPEKTFVQDAETVAVKKEDLDTTMALDSPPVLAGDAGETGEKDQDVDFADVFEESMEDLEKFEAGSPEDLQDLLEEESAVTPPDEAVTKEELPPAVPEERGKEESEEIVEGPPTVSAPKKSARSPLRLIILVILLALIGAAIAIFFWAPDLIPDSMSFLKPVEKQVAIDSGIRRLKFPSVNGSFVDSKKTGRLFVIQGTIKNNYPKSRSFVLIKGTILDDGGRPVKMKMAYAGNAFKESEIKVLALEEINRAMKNRLGKGKKNVDVAPGATVPFTIVFENLPENLGEFSVEAVSSSPGTK